MQSIPILDGSSTLPASTILLWNLQDKKLMYKTSQLKQWKIYFSKV